MPFKTQGNCITRDNRDQLDCNQCYHETSRAEREREMHQQHHMVTNIAKLTRTNVTEE